MAILLSAVAFAIAQFWNLMAGSALAAVAVFVALRPLFIKQPEAGQAAEAEAPEP
jgi:hypothetical protein